MCLLPFQYVFSCTSFWTFIYNKINYQIWKWGWFTRIICYNFLCKKFRRTLYFRKRFINFNEFIMEFKGWISFPKATSRPRFLCCRLCSCSRDICRSVILHEVSVRTFFVLRNYTGNSRQRVCVLRQREKFSTESWKGIVFGRRRYQVPGVSTILEHDKYSWRSFVRGYCFWYFGDCNIATDRPSPVKENSKLNTLSKKKIRTSIYVGMKVMHMKCFIKIYILQSNVLSIKFCLIVNH